MVLGGIARYLSESYLMTVSLIAIDINDPQWDPHRYHLLCCKLIIS